MEGAIVKPADPKSAQLLRLTARAAATEDLMFELERALLDERIKVRCCVRPSVRPRFLFSSFFLCRVVMVIDVVCSNSTAHDPRVFCLFLEHSLCGLLAAPAPQSVHTHTHAPHPRAH